MLNIGRDTDTRGIDSYSTIILKNEQKANSIERKAEGLPTAVWDYKELVHLMHQEVRQTWLKNCSKGRRKQSNLLKSINRSIDHR